VLQICYMTRKIEAVPGYYEEKLLNTKMGQVLKKINQIASEPLGQKQALTEEKQNAILRAANIIAKTDFNELSTPQKKKLLSILAMDLQNYTCYQLDLIIKRYEQI